MGKVLKLGGKAIIALANFESLGFKLGRKMPVCSVKLWEGNGKWVEIVGEA